jgi:transposase-like protein
MTRRRPRAYWRRLVAKQGESGLKAADFCREHKINLQQFYRWRRRFRNEESKSVSDGFVELVPCLTEPDSGVRIRLGDTLSIEVERGFDPVTLRAVIETISSWAEQPCLP